MMTRQPAHGFWTACVGICAMVLGTCLLGSVLGLRGCMNEHSRGQGHFDISLAFSPDGKKLVFNGVGEGGLDLYLLDYDTMAVTRIAETPQYEITPSFTPDGLSILYAAGTPGDRADHIYVRPIAGGRATRLTNSDANDSWPAMSPDGSVILFARETHYNWGGKASNWNQAGALMAMAPDGESVREILPESDHVGSIHFASRGSLVFHTINGPRRMNADLKGEPQPIGGLRDWGLKTSPDGGRLVFTSGGPYARDVGVYISRADGSNPRLVYHPPDGCSSPIFTPNGKQILFFASIWPDGLTGDCKSNLWIVDVDGKNARQVADYTLLDDPLGWRPR